MTADYENIAVEKDKEIIEQKYLKKYRKSVVFKYISLTFFYQLIKTPTIC